jgi:glycosyltransferase involved in cell wall biosynthesis
MMTLGLSDLAVHVHRHRALPFDRSRLGGSQRALGRLVAKYLDECGRPDVLHAQSSFWAGCAIARPAAKLGLPFVVTEHSSLFLTADIDSRRLAIARTALRRASRLIAVSRALASRLELLIDREVEVVGNVVDTRFFRPAEEPIPRVPGWRLLVVANLEAIKRVDLALRCFRILMDRRLPVTELRIVGSGSNLASLRSMSDSLGIGQYVTFLGGLDRIGVRQEMWKSDVLVVSSDIETFGLVLAEAAATGLRTVSTPCGGPEGFVESVGGVIAGCRGDAHELADAVVDVMNRRDMTQEERHKAVTRQFSAEEIGSRLVGLYESVLR